MVLIISVDHGRVAAMQISFVHRLILGFQGFLVLHRANLAAMSRDDALDPNLVIAHGRAVMLVRRYFSFLAQKVFFHASDHQVFRQHRNQGPAPPTCCAVVFCAFFSISKARSLTNCHHNMIKVTWMYVMLCQLYVDLHWVTRALLARFQSTCFSYSDHFINI